MALIKGFTIFEEETRLIQHQDCLYKVKLCYKNIPSCHNLQEPGIQSVINLELEDVIRAVIHIAVGDGDMVLIQTDNFYVQPTLKPWKAQQKLRFQQNGEDLEVYENVINLMMTPHFSGLLWRKQQSGFLHNSSEKPRVNSGSENSRLDSGVECTSDEPASTASVQASSHTLAQNTVSYTAETARSDSRSSQRLGIVDTQKSQERDKKYSSSLMSQNDTGHAEHAETTTKHDQNDARCSDPVEKSPKLTDKVIARSSQSQSPQRSPRKRHVTVSQESLQSGGKDNVSDSRSARERSARRQTKVGSSSPRRERLRSLRNRKSPPATVYGRPRIQDSPRNRVSRNRRETVLYTQQSPHCQTDQRHGNDVLDRNQNSSSATSTAQKSPRKKRNMSELQFLERKQSGTQTDGSPSVKSPRLSQHQGQGDSAQNGIRYSLRTSVQHKRTILTRRAMAEENQRLENLSSDSPRRTRARTFYQKDRFVVEQSDLLEELKLQQLASTDQASQGSPSQKRKRQRKSWLEMMTDNVVTPVKYLFRRARGKPTTS